MVNADGAATHYPRDSIKVIKLLLSEEHIQKDDNLRPKQPEVTSSTFN